MSWHTPIPLRRPEEEPTLDDDEDDVSYRVPKRACLEDLKDLIRKEVEQAGAMLSKQPTPVFGEKNCCKTNSLFY